MGANATNAVFFLISTLFDLALWLWLLRILLQVVRADFYNPISQLVWQLTRFPADWLRPYLPRPRNVDIASVLVLAALTLIYVQVIGSLLGIGIGAATLPYAALKLLVHTINLYTFTLFVQALLSWLGPGVNNPAANILWSLNEPLLRPIRRVLPSMSGLDLSPLALILLLQVLARLIPLPAVFR